jgi:integrase
MSVKKRGKGWQATIRDPEGREVTKTFPKKVQAEQWETSKKNDRLRGSWVDRQAGLIKLADWVVEYSERATHRRATTIARDNAVLDHWIIPAFGNRPLSSITPNDIKGLVSSMENVGLAPRTVRTNFGVLRALLNAAVLDRKIAMSPCLGIRLPEVRKTAKPIASVEDLVRLADAVPGEYAPAIYLGALGLRIQEVCGLKVKAIDFLRRTLTVELTVNEVDGKIVFGEGKTLSRQREPLRCPSRLSTCSRNTYG